MASLYTPTITYNPVTDPFGKRVTHYQVERSPGDGFVYECLFDPNTGTPTPFYRPDSIIVGTASVFMHENFCYPGPRASYSVFLGPSNPLNIAGAPLPDPKTLGLPFHVFQSAQRGSLCGAIATIKTVIHILEKAVLPSRGGMLRRMVVKSDSEYLVRGVTEWVYTWMRKGWVASANPRVSDWDLWEEFLELLGHIQGIWRVEVYFWWVPTQWNRNARTLAALGLRIPPPIGPAGRQVGSDHVSSSCPELGMRIRGEAERSRTRIKEAASKGMGKRSRAELDDAWCADRGKRCRTGFDDDCTVMDVD